MLPPARSLLVVALVLGALFSGLACGGSGSRVSSSMVSNSNVDKLIAADKYILEFDAGMEAANNACKYDPLFTAKGFECRKEHRLEYYAGLKSAMVTYDQVANETADGKRQKALRQMARVLRVNADSSGGKIVKGKTLKQLKQASGDAKLLDLLYPGVIEKTKKAVPPACDLKVVKAK